MLWCVQAFAAAVHSILRWHTSALNQLPAAVKQRRQAERSMHSMQSTGMDKGGGDAAMPPVTILEVVLHTQHLQVVLGCYQYHMGMLSHQKLGPLQVLMGMFSHQSA